MGQPDKYVEGGWVRREEERQIAEMEQHSIQEEKETMLPIILHYRH